MTQHSEFSGKLEFLAVAGIFKDLFQRKSSGQLQCTSGAVSKRIILKNGLVIYSSSNFEKDRLGDVLLTRRRYCLDVTRHVTRCQAMRPQAGNGQMREVLANTPAMLEHMRERRGDRSETRVVGEGGMDTLHQILHSLQQ